MVKKNRFVRESVSKLYSGPNMRHGHGPGSSGTNPFGLAVAALAICIYGSPQVRTIFGRLGVSWQLQEPHKMTDASHR